MAARHYTLAITAAAQRLSNALSPTTRGGSADEAFRQVRLTASTDCFIGGADVTTTAYGQKLFAEAATTVPCDIGPFPDGPVKLSDLFVVGTSGTLYILGIPY